MSHIQPAWQQPNLLSQQVGSLQEQIRQMEEKHIEKIKESEHNLHAQYQSLTQQQQVSKSRYRIKTKSISLSPDTNCRAH